MLCFLARKKISNVCACGGRLTGRVEQHIQDCAACNEFAQQHGQMYASLASAKHPEGELPPFLHRRIMHALEAEERPAAARGGLTIRSVGAVCAMLSIVFGLFLFQSWQSKKADLLADVEHESFQSLEIGVEQVEQLVSDAPNILTQPLTAELMLLQEDLLTVAEKLDAHLNGAVFAMLSSENG